VALLARARFGRVQLAFVVIGIAVSLAYAFSAVLARPDWGRTASSLVIPHGNLTAAYLLAVVGTVGTTITP
jgi:Mn2+/Fe2+ NRAMP family transporter